METQRTYLRHRAHNHRPQPQRGHPQPSGVAADQPPRLRRAKLDVHAAAAFAAIGDHLHHHQEHAIPSPGRLQHRSQHHPLDEGKADDGVRGEAVVVRHAKHFAVDGHVARQKPADQRHMAAQDGPVVGGEEEGESGVERPQPHPPFLRQVLLRRKDDPNEEEHDVIGLQAQNGGQPVKGGLIEASKVHCRGGGGGGKKKRKNNTQFCFFQIFSMSTELN